jgi:light-regulated signal transduction histidine kinase (bacteriophytochrome)
MQRLIKDLLTYSQVESRGSTFIRVDLNEVVKQVLDVLQLSIAEAQAEVVVEPLPWVNADPTQMHQVFQNLIGNAVKFRGERIPRIVISTTPEPGSPEKARISVQDNGIGIDPSDADKLFGMFQRGHHRERYPGTGIGLAVSKRVIERHAGKIWVEPTPGGGSTFLFTLPTAQPRKAASVELDAHEQRGAPNDDDGVNHQSIDR